MQEKKKNARKKCTKEILNPMEDKAKPDPELKDFFRNSENFADLFNGVCFGGTPVLKPDDLLEMDTDVSGVIVAKEYRNSLVRNRDVLKKATNETRFVLFGVENQNTVDYTMPLRVMIYDGMNYVKEAKEAQKVSGQRQETLKITPVVTIVLYYGTKLWNGPITLKEMMGHLPEQFQEIVSDYKMNLVEVLHGTYLFHTENVKMLFEYSQALVKKDQKKLQHLDKVCPLKKEVIYAIGKFVNIDEIKVKLQHENKEVISMCELFDDIREEGRIEGILIGETRGEARGEARGMQILISTLKELHWNENEIHNYVTQKFNLENLS